MQTARDQASHVLAAEASRTANSLVRVAKHAASPKDSNRPTSEQSAPNASKFIQKVSDLSRKVKQEI